MKKILLVFIMFILLFTISASVSAVQINKIHEFTLLAVSQQEDGTAKGGTAKLYLAVKPGSGSIFIESFPTAKIDTQVATRLANEIACEFSQVNCKQYDFFYTIHADSPLIGGPSAGGATAVLTLAVLEEIPLRKDVAMTGTITSGGIIGPVAGVVEKVEAAQREGNVKAIIPYTTIIKNISLADNFTLETFVSYSDFENFSIEVFPVMHLEEALRIASSKKLPAILFSQAQPTESYQNQMALTATTLCNRSKDLMTRAQEKGLSQEDIFIAGNELYNKSVSAFLQEKYYPQASFCFSANLRFRQLLLQDLDQELLLENFQRLQNSMHLFDEQLQSVDFKTFSDLETYSIVKERLLEAKKYTSAINESNISSTVLASAIERYYSGVAWSSFFGLPGKPLVIDELSLERACLEEIRNVQSRMSYLETFLPEMYLEDHKKSLSHVYDYAHEGEFALCLFKASKTKAELNLYLSSISLQNASLSDVIVAKQNRTAQLIQQQKNNDIFPILGYSYYDYVPLLFDDEVTSFLFAEYALALSDLQNYFPQKSRFSFLFRSVDILIFLTGFFVGLFVMFVITNKKRSTSVTARKK
jgi:uncharacterized protein